MFKGQEIVVIEEIHKNIWVVDEGAGLIYLVKGRNKCAVIDTGFGFCDLPALTRDIAGDMPTIVLNTHAHQDHIWGNNMFEEAFMGCFDEPFALGCLAGIYVEKNEVYEGRSDFLKRGGITLENWNPGCCKKINPLYAGDRLDLGGLSLEVYEIPGHTLGSIAFLERASGILFTGDSLFTSDIWMHLRESTRLSVFLRSLKKLRQDIHGIATSLAVGHQKENCPYLLPYQLTDNVINGISGILNGIIVGVPITTFQGGGLRADFNSFGGVIYNSARL